MSEQFPPPPPITAEDVLAILKNQNDMFLETMAKMQQDNLKLISELQAQIAEDSIAQEVARDRVDREIEDQAHWERFTEQAPPPFLVAATPSDAEIWIIRLEKAHSTLGCTDEQKVDTAVRLLQGPTADLWAKGS